jgi:hypothetical protein
MKTVSKKEARIKAGRKMIKALKDRGVKQETRLALIQMLDGMREGKRTGGGDRTPGMCIWGTRK